MSVRQSVRAMRTGQSDSWFARFQAISPLVKTVLITTFCSCAFGREVSFLGFSAQGIAWVVVFVVAGYSLLRRGPKRQRPIMWYIWIPWIMVILAYLIVAPYTHALQRAMMMLCPILTGLAGSSTAVRQTDLENLWIVLKAMAEWLVILFFVSGVASLVLPIGVGIAALAMTGSVLASLFAAEYAMFGRMSALLYWLSLMAMPFLAVTRMGILANLVTLVANMAPLKLAKRAGLVLLVMLVGVSMFYSERVQKKMFRTGEGSFEDLRLDNPQLQDHGRKAMWLLVEEGIKDSPWLGHGANAIDDQILTPYAGRETHAHNDWLRLLYDYGYFGTGVFVFCIIVQIIHAAAVARKSKGLTACLLYGGATAYIPFALFMYTDNIILYVSFFGNLQFAMLGMGYAAVRTAEADQKRQRALEKRQRTVEAYARQHVSVR